MTFHFMQWPLTLDDLERSNSSKEVIHISDIDTGKGHHLLMVYASSYIKHVKSS